MSKLRIDEKEEIRLRRGRLFVPNQKNIMGRGPEARESILNLRN